MAILLTEDGTELIAECGCGCEDGVHIKIQPDEQDFAYLSYTNGSFYRDQYGAFSTLRKKLRKIWAIICNKDYYYSEIIMRKEDFEKFKAYINQF